MMKAMRREPVDRTPVWLMRQAGRYMAEYRAVRERMSFLELCRNPKLCAEVMQTAVEKIGVDAAIIFSDLLLILEAMGFNLEFSAGDGPVLHNPLRTATDLKVIHELMDVSSLDYVFETVSETRKVISRDKPVIGFAGAPFTLAGYAIEGGGSRSFLHTKKLMYTRPDVWHEFMERIARSAARYLNAQIDAGASIVQVFDSWVGCLGVEDYRRFVLPHTRLLMELVTTGTPIIYFGTGNPALLGEFAKVGDCALGIDWRTSLTSAWKTVGDDRVLQGNLDPAVLLASPDFIRQEVRRILTETKGHPGFIFNLGHGVLKETPVENVRILVDAVHEGIS